MARMVTYRGHQIRAHAIPLPESEEGEWAAQAVISVLVAGRMQEQHLPDADDRTFATQEDAEGSAVHMAMRWVDRHGT